MIKKASPKLQYASAKTFDPTKLEEFYTVKVLSGPFKYYRPTSWYKRFMKRPELVTGWNNVDNTICGHFNVIPKEDHVELNYEVDENRYLLWLNLKDRLRYSKASDTFIGKIYLKTFWVYVPCGYFTLTAK